MTDESKSMTRAEWIAAGAMGVNVLGFAFGGGALWQMVNDHDKRLTAVEALDRSRAAQMTEILVRLERIDANTTALKERVGQQEN
jgi:hypothetical protein